MNRLDELLMGQERIITKRNITEDMHELLPLIEEESQLKANLKKPNIKLLDKGLFFTYNYPLLNHPVFLGGKYGIKENTFYFPRKFYGNEDYLKKCVAHELVHYFQHFNFPELRHHSKWEKPFKFLKEGDAELVSNNISKKYFSEIKWAREEIRIFLEECGLIEDYEEFGLPYTKGEEILREKFNGERKSINSLYTLSLKELAEVFNLQ